MNKRINLLEKILFHNEISFHFNLFYFNERLGFEHYLNKINRINNADLFLQTLFIFTN